MEQEAAVPTFDVSAQLSCASPGGRSPRESIIYWLWFESPFEQQRLLQHAFVSMFNVSQLSDQIQGD